MSYFKVKKNKYSSFKKILKIAEIGCNHNNNFRQCSKLIDVAKKTGFDAVKFQLFKANELVPKNTKGYKILSKYELNEEWIRKISKYCKKKKILFACSPFYKEAVDLLVKYKCDILKIASPEIKNLQLLEYASKTEIPLIISTGDSSIKIIENAKKLLNKKNKKINSFLHCVSEYPTKIKNLNLLNINYLKNKLNGYQVGFSDHSLGIDACVNAVSLGASIIEKHITLSKRDLGPDHFFAIEPKECSEMINKINELILSLGNSEKKRLNDENSVYIKIFSKKNLKIGERLSLNKVRFLRTLNNKGIDCKDFNIFKNKIIKKKLMRDKLVTKKIFYS